jgi:hypothetical protein
MTWQCQNGLAVAVHFRAGADHLGEQVGDRRGGPVV